MSEQIGASSNDTQPTLTFYIKSMGVRRLLFPEIRGGKKGYNCVTITNVDAAESTDRIVVTQTEFEKILVEMHLMEPKAPSRRLGPTWPTAMDSATRGVNKLVGFVSKNLLSRDPSRTLETWLPILK